MSFRLFCDRYSTPGRAEALLYLADALAIVSAILFASGALYFGRGALDALLLALWALIPRSTAHLLERVGIPRGVLLSFLVSCGFVLGVVALILAGWELFSASLPLELPLRLTSGVVIVITWSLGFLLHQARTYRVQDFFLGSTVLLGLLQSMPHALFWIALYLVGTSLSLVSRRVLFDVFPAPRRPPLNLHDARSLAGLLALLGFGVIVGTWLALGTTLGPTPARRLGVDLSRYTWNDLAEESDLVRANRSDRPDRGSARAKTTVGFSAEVRLQDLASPRFDERVVFTADPLPGSRYRPDPFTLWRVLSFAEYSPENGSWRDDVELEETGWPEDDRIETNPCERDRSNAQSLDGLRIEITTPLLIHLASPYFVASYENASVGGRGVGVNVRPSSYARSGSDDILIRPSLEGRGSYVVHFEPIAAGRSLPPTSSGLVEPHPDPRYLRVPANASATLDLTSYALAHVDNHGPVRRRVERLLEHLRDEFLRSDRYAWSTAGDPLGNFLARERRGDCTYFATASALLLRAVGVPTRLVVGFVGGERLGDGSIRVRNRTAHAWIEVWDTGFGWFPVDPTAWVTRLDPDDPRATPTAPTEPEFADLDELRAAGVDGDADLEGEDPELAARSRPSDESPGSSGRHGDPGLDGDGDETPAGAIPEDSAREAGGSWISFTPKALDPFSPRAQAGDGGEITEPLAPLQDRARILRIVLAAVAAGAVLLLVGAIRRSKKAVEEESPDEEEELSEEELALLAARQSTILGERPDDPSEALLWEYASLQRDLRRVRHHRRSHETPLEHAARYRGDDERLDGAFASLHRWLYFVLYGRHRVEEDALKSVRESAARVRRLLR